MFQIWSKKRRFAHDNNCGVLGMTGRAVSLRGRQSEAISTFKGRDCFASLAMTGLVSH